MVLVEQLLLTILVAKVDLLAQMALLQHNF
jgi:hypothetical protein